MVLLSVFTQLALLSVCVSSVHVHIPPRLGIWRRDTDHDHFPLPSCPAYAEYSSTSHGPLSEGPLQLPYMRPSEECRTFKSSTVEQVIQSFTKQMADPDLARLFENCFPNTLDTTVRWHSSNSNGNGPRSFIITGDINAEWLRDSRNQLKNYQILAKHDEDIATLLEGAIHTQAEYVTKQPYCNAFQPPAESGLRSSNNNQDDSVTPAYDPNVVFECKYELDSLAAFLGLANDYYKATGKTGFIDSAFIQAVQTTYNTIKDQQIPTYAADGSVNKPKYRFNRHTDVGTETLSLSGAGNPVNGGTNLVRSAFRPSDDATIFQFFIPANAMVAVELKRAGSMLAKTQYSELAKQLSSLGNDIEKDVWLYGTTDHPKFGKVFAFEVDGFGSQNMMDDANVPSLLALPDYGFVDKSNNIYQNTRKMILSKQGNPYYLEGPYFDGIGGPHIGTHNAWPMSHLLRIRTTDDDNEIRSNLETVKKSTAGLGLIHESVAVDEPGKYTRPWFAWANTEFARTVIDLAERKPHLIFTSGTKLTLKKAITGKQ